MFTHVTNLSCLYQLAVIKLVSAKVSQNLMRALQTAVFKVNLSCRARVHPERWMLRTTVASERDQQQSS
jgi:hypothetical protein